MFLAWRSFRSKDYTRYGKDQAMYSAELAMVKKPHFSHFLAFVAASRLTQPQGFRPPHSRFSLFLHLTSHAPFALSRRLEAVWMRIHENM
jgi:hypothetical protein